MVAKKTKNTLLILVFGFVFLTGSIGCSTTRITALDGDIYPLPVGTIIQTEDGPIPVTSPSYLITERFLEEIARVRLEEK